MTSHRLGLGSATSMAALLLAGTLSPMAFAQNPDTGFPCEIRPFDSSPSIAVFPTDLPIEFCAPTPVPELCSSDLGRYWTTHVIANLVEVADSKKVFPGTADASVKVKTRKGPEKGPPLDPPTSEADLVAKNVPTFGSIAESYVTATHNALGRFSVGFAAVELTSACVGIDPVENPNLALGADTESVIFWWFLKTIIWLTGELFGHEGRTGSVSPAHGPSQIGLGLIVAPYAGLFRGADEVPPNNSTGSGTCVAVVDDASTLSVRIDLEGVSGTVSAAHVHQAPAGENGPILFPLGAPVPDIHVNFDFPSVSADVVKALKADELYVNVHTDAQPDGEIRCQLLNVDGQVIFADGFESGDTSAWSTKVP